MNTKLPTRPQLAMLLLAAVCLCIPLPAARAQSDSATYPHVSVLAGIGLGFSRGTANYLPYIEKNGFHVYNYSSLFDGGNNTVTGGSGPLLAAEYQRWPRAAVGIAFSSLGVLLGAEPRVLGEKYVSNGRSIVLLETHRSSGYYVYGAWYLTPVTQRSRRTVVRTAIGFGMSHIRTSLVAAGDQYYYQRSTDPVPNGSNEMLVSRDAFSVLGLLTAEWLLSRELWLGLSFEYRYTPDLRFDEATLRGIDSFSPPSEATVTLPAHSINFSSLKFGLFLAWRK